MKTFSYFIIFLVTMLAAGCGRGDGNRILAGAASLADDRPEDARVLLDSIDYSSLSAADRHSYDLLSIKTDDKLFVEHSSDSLINTVVDYYASRPNDPHYPEALYYAGRVNHTIGDYPTALAYYQDALERLPKDKDNDKLRSHIIAQTAALLSGLRMYSQAIPYTKRVIDLEIASKDTVNLIYDLELIASLYTNLKKHDKATNALAKAMELASKTGMNKEMIRCRMYMAKSLLWQNDIASALRLIRTCKVDSPTYYQDIALTHACQIYLKANIPDTAYKYAKQLSEMTDSRNRKTGFKVMLSPELIKRIPSDSLVNVVETYRDVMDEYYDSHDSELAIMQQSQFNYAMHKKAKEKAEEKSTTLSYTVSLLIIIVLALTLLFLIARLRNKTISLELHKAYEELNLMKLLLNDSKDEKGSMEGNLYVDTEVDNQALREKILSELTAMSMQVEKNSAVDPHILDSKPYSQIIESIECGKTISHHDQLWTRLEKTVLDISPDFIKKLNILSDGQLKSQDFHMALLIKCGLRPQDISALMGKSKGTISYYRKMLRLKTIGDEVDPNIIDKFIRIM